MASPFWKYVRQREGFWMLQRLQQKVSRAAFSKCYSTNIPCKAVLLAVFDFLCFDTDSVMAWLKFTTGSLGVHLCEFGAEQQNLR
jgi:hypothetical protein